MYQPLNCKKHFLRYPLVALGPGALHRVADGGRRLDRPQLDAVHLDAPLAGGLVQDGAQLRVDLLTRGECLFQVKAADDVAQRRHSELLDGLDVVLRFVGGADRYNYI